MQKFGSKNGILINSDINVKNWLIGAFVNMLTCRILAKMIVSKINNVK